MGKRIAVALIVCGMVMATPSRSLAKGEITGVIGGLIGGDLNNVLSGNISVGGAFENGPLYGVRLGWIIPLFGLEASYVYSPSGVSLSIPNVQAGVNGKVHYLEGNALWIIIPGPVAPFVTAGAGLHWYDLDVVAPNASADAGELKKLGFNFGGGIKINIKAITIRGEVRDHVTRVGPGDFNLTSVNADILSDSTLHNIEISGGVGFRF
jgi:hypothetical protein